MVENTFRNWTPGNRRDFDRYLRCTPEQAEAVTARASELYDGTRTVAACWRIALAEAGK